MNVSFNDFVKAKVETGQFWVFAVGSVEWQYILAEMGKEFFPKVLEELDDFGAIVPDDRTLMDPVYWARKSMLPVEALEKRLGVSPAALNKAKLIRLKAFPPQPVAATVDYYGRA